MPVLQVRASASSNSRTINTFLLLHGITAIRAPQKLEALDLVGTEQIVTRQGRGRHRHRCVSDQSGIDTMRPRRPHRRRTRGGGRDSVQHHHQERALVTSAQLSLFPTLDHDDAVGIEIGENNACKNCEN